MITLFMIAIACILLFLVLGLIIVLSGAITVLWPILLIFGVLFLADWLLLKTVFGRRKKK